MIPFLALVRKDLQLFFSDKRAVLMGLVVPIVLASFLGYLFGGNRSAPEIGKIPVLVIDQDNSEVSRAIVAQLNSEKNLEVKPSELGAAREQVREGKIRAAIIIPKEFGAGAGRAFFTSAAKPEIKMLFDPSHGMELGMIQGILTGAVMQGVSKEMFTGDMGRKQMKESLAAVEADKDMPADTKKVLRGLLSNVEAWNQIQNREPEAAQAGPARGLTIPFTTQTEAVTSGEGVLYNGYAHTFGGMGVQFILFFGLDMGIRLLLLRQSGLWQRLRAAPVSRVMLLGSRTVSAALISGFILCVLFTFARIVFQVQVRGSLLGFVLVCAAFSFMTAAFGLMIAALGKTVEGTRGFSIMATLIMVMLGGAWAPTFIFPQWLQKVTVVVPTRWAMDGIDNMTWRGLGLSSALWPVGALLLFTLLFGIVAVTQFRWETEG